MHESIKNISNSMPAMDLQNDQHIFSISVCKLIKVLSLWFTPINFHEISDGASYKGGM